MLLLVGVGLSPATLVISPFLLALLFVLVGIFRRECVLTRPTCSRRAAFATLDPLPDKWMPTHSHKPLLFGI